MWPITDDQLRDALRHLPVVIYQETHEPEPRLSYLSPNAGVIMGAGADEHLRDPDLWWRSIDPRDQDTVASAWDLAYRTEQPYTLDYRYRRPDGRTVWLRDQETPIRGDDGSVTHWQGVLLDVTTERTATDELATSEARHRDLVEHLPAAVYTLTTDDPPEFLFVSEAIEDICGYGVERWIAEPELAMAIVHPDDLDEVSTAWATARRTGMPFELTYRIRHADGAFRWIAERIHPVRRGGAVVEWEGITFDVTREREASFALKESERRHEQLLQQIPGAAFSLLQGPPRRFDYLSPRIQDILGYPRSLWFDDDGFWTSVVHPDDLDDVQREWARCVEERVPFRMEYRAIHADGHIVWLRADTLPISGPDDEIERWQGLWLDVTEAKTAEEERIAAETRYQQLVEHAPAIVLTADPSGAVRFIGPQVEAMLGYPAERWAEDPFFWKELLHPDDLDRVLQEWQEVSEGELPYDSEYRLLRSDGTYRWVRDVTHPARDADGTVSGWHGLTIDVHEMHLAQEARAVAEARARALLENVPAVVYEMGPDDERRTLFVSSHIERLLGYSRQEWLDQPDIWIELLHPDDREDELSAHDEHSSTGEPWSREYRLIAADGQVVWVRDQATLAIDVDGSPVWQGVLVDVTSQHMTTALLRITNEELERRIRERTAEFEEANALMGLEIGERRRAEKEASAARERHRVLVENMPAVAYIWRTAAHAEEEPDADYYMSPQLEEILGYTPEEWHEGACWLERLHPHDRDAVVTEMLRCEGTGEPFTMEFRYFAKDGRIVWIEDHASLLSRLPDGRPALFHGVMLDVTERKTAEAAAEEARELVRQITEEAPVSSYLLNVVPGDPPTMSIEHVRGQLSATFGHDISVWREHPEYWAEAVHPDDLDRVREAHRAVWTSGAPLQIDYRMIASDGQIVWLRDRCRCIAWDDGGRPIRFVGTLVDVTDEVEKLASIEEELTQLRTVVETIPAVSWILTVDDDGSDARYLYLSPQAEQLLGSTREEIIAERAHLTSMAHPDDEARIGDSWREACLSGADVWEDRYRVRHRDGEIRGLYTRARRVSEPDADRIVWVGASVDVTEVRDRAPADPGRT